MLGNKQERDKAYGTRHHAPMRTQERASLCTHAGSGCSRSPMQHFRLSPHATFHSSGSGDHSSNALLPPLLLLAHPYANSLPSALETLARLQQDGLKGCIAYLPSSAEPDQQADHKPDQQPDQQAPRGVSWDTLRSALKVNMHRVGCHASSGF